MAYKRNIDRLPTLKLTEDEWIALAMAAVLDIGEQPIRDVALDVLGPHRYRRLFIEKQSTRTTKRENQLLIQGIYPYIPGGNRKSKEIYLIELGRRVFNDDTRFLDVLAFIRDRVKEYEAAGGTIELYPSMDTERWQGKQNVLVDPGELIRWMTPEENPKAVYQYDSGYYCTRSMDPAAVAKKHWQGISDVAERAGHPDFRHQSSDPVAYTVNVLSWFTPHGQRVPDVTLHEMFYDGGYSLKWEIGNSRDHFGRVGSAEGDIIGPDGSVVANMDVNHNRKTSLRY